MRFLTLVVVAFILFASGSAASAQVPVTPDPSNPIPIMAYYYIWFDTRSWDRAKTDYPLLGRYSSDDRSVMEQHVQWAKSADINGFIVSWKSTLTLNRRLEQLMDVATKNNFKLWIIYEGLDFERKPLPVDRIVSDLDYFVANYASSPAFAMYDRPVVILSGTWEFTPSEIRTITSTLRGYLYILASEHNVDGYLRLADNVDGDAYYWSSVNPSTYPNYQGKLDDMSMAVHEHGGLWIAPAAPGFDARLIGGTRIVSRNNGETLRIQLDTALRSSPDAIGLISWNEFSENTHIEPSKNYGTSALNVLSARQLAEAPMLLDFDSNAQGTSSTLGQSYSLFVIAAMSMLILVFISVAIIRRVKR